MKIVHSFWTKPYISSKNSDPFCKTNGGWLEPKYNYYSWALSCLKFREFYDIVELYTDDLGKEILIDKLKLPYSKVHVVLNALDAYNPKLWSLGKIYTYGIQDEPFIHADSDVYIWEKLNVETENSSLIVQSSETAYNLYRKVIDDIRTNFTYIPNELEQFCTKYSELPCINSGIIGGTDYTFFALFKERAFEVIHRNIEHLEKIDLGPFSITLDQFYFNSLADKFGKEVTRLFLDVDKDDYAGIMKFNLVPIHDKYIHLISFAKRNILACEQLEYRLKYEFPEYYYLINDFLATEKNISSKMVINKSSDIMIEEVSDFLGSLTSKSQVSKMISGLHPSHLINGQLTVREKTNILAEEMVAAISVLNKEKEIFDAFNCLYSHTIDSFLEIRFKLSDTVILLLNDQIEKEQFIYYSCSNNELKAERLIDWDQLLPNFSTPMSGWALIEELFKEKQVQETFSMQQLTLGVLDFLTTKWVYQRILIPSFDNLEFNFERTINSSFYERPI